MATERNARPISSFVKFNDLGDMAAGKIREFRKSVHGTFMVLEPAFVRKGRKGKVEAYASASVGISTDVSTKIDPSSDTGKFLSFVLDDTEPTTKGSHRKIFRVLELNNSEVGSLNAHADMSRAKDPYLTDEQKPQMEISGGDEEGNGEDAGDLPF